MNKVFISHSHLDKDFVDKLALELIKGNIPIWLDRWELKVGDSITQKVEENLSESDFLLIVFSNQSIESDWVKREVTAGLMREIEEKRAIILPVVIDDCKIPLFIRDKLYADFKNDFDFGCSQIKDCLARYYSQNQFQIDTKDYETDWGIEWRADSLEKKVFVDIDTISYNKIKQYSILFSMSIVGNEYSYNRLQDFAEENLGWYYKNILFCMVVNYIKQKGGKILLEDSYSKFLSGTFFDEKNDFILNFNMRFKWLGTDTGDNILFHYDAMLDNTVEHLKKIENCMDSKTKEKLKKILQNKRA